MMKTIACFLILAMLLPVLSGCKTYPDDPLEAMPIAFIEKKGYSTSPDDVWVEYFGCFENVHIGMMWGDLSVSPASHTEEIGGFEFKYFDRRSLQAYKNGKIMDLKEAYEKGWLSDAALEDIWEKYKEARPNQYD